MVSAPVTPPVRVSLLDFQVLLLAHEFPSFEYSARSSLSMRRRALLLQSLQVSMRPLLSMGTTIVLRILLSLPMVSHAASNASMMRDFSSFVRFMTCGLRPMFYALLVHQSLFSRELFFPSSYARFALGLNRHGTEDRLQINHTEMYAETSRTICHGPCKKMISQATQGTGTSFFAFRLECLYSWFTPVSQTPSSTVRGC